MFLNEGFDDNDVRAYLKQGVDMSVDQILN
jgi:hypothetical protein